MTTDSKQLSKPTTTVNDDIDLLAMLFTLLRSWKMIIFFALIGLIIGILYSRYLNPVFKSDALIQIEKNSQSITALGSNISDLVSSESSPAQTEAELIKSRMILQPVVDLLHLGIRLSDPNVSKVDRIKRSRTDTQINSSEGVALDTDSGTIKISQFNVSKNYLNKKFTIIQGTSKDSFILSNGFDDFKGQLNKPHRFIGTDGVIQITVESLPNDNYPIDIVKLSLQNSTDSIKSSLSVLEKGNQTGIIELSMTGENQEQVSLILREIVQSYITKNELRGTEETTKTLDFMETQIPALKQKLEDSENLFNKFREKYGTIDITQEASLLVSEKSQIDAQMNELKLKKADLTTYYTDEHPLVIQINEQYKVLSDRRNEIDSKVASLPETQRQFLKLSEDTGINREIYLTMLKNYQQLKIVKAGQVGYVRIIDLPISTYRVTAPNKQLIILMMTMVGLVLGIVLALIKNLLKQVVKDPERLEEKTGIPVIATIPRSAPLSRMTKNKKASGKLLAYSDSNSLSYEAIKSLRTHLMFAMPSKGKTGKRAKVIVISGESPGIGKSFVSSNLAEVFGQLHKKVLIIDADMRLGELHKAFNMDFNNGLSDYLSQSNDLEAFENIADFVHPTSMEYVDFMPRGQHSANPTALIASDVFDDLMSQINAHYDYIVIDTPPVLAASDAIVLSRYADKVLMVTRYDKSIEGQLVYAINQLNKANVQVDGIILNDVQQGLMSKYSYHYSYAYGNNK